MTATNNEIMQSLLEAINLVADSSSKNADSTLTIEAEIVEIEDAGVGTYIIQYMENKFKAYSTNGAQYSVGDIVYVLIPDKDFL